MSSGEFSPKTDAYAVGVTLLVCLSGRAAEGIFDACETAFDTDFADIDPTALAEPSVGWPASVSRSLAPLVLAREQISSLCTPKKRKRLELSAATETLATLLATGAKDRTDMAKGMLADAASSASASSPPPALSDASKLVRKLGRAAAPSEDGEQMRRLQQKASEGFRHLMARLDKAHSSHAASAPADFRERIDYWLSCGPLQPALHDRLHRLRKWRNASEHGDEARWKREGPRDEDELVDMLRACDTLAERLDLEK